MDIGYALEKSYLTNEQWEEIYLLMPQFVFYKKRGHIYDCFCTACKSTYQIDDRINMNTVRHNDVGTCHICSAQIQYKSKGFGLRKYCHRENFAVFCAVDNNVVIRCYKGYQTFDDSDPYIPQIELYKYAIYTIEPGKATKYHEHYLYGWIPNKSKPGEPGMGIGCGCCCDYILVSQDCLKDTFLKHIVNNLPENISSHFISYLCRCTEHPNLEFLFKGGFYQLGMSYVRGGSIGRVNWKSNDLMKMLHINRTELAYLRDKNCNTYLSYMEFRKEFQNSGQIKGTENTIEMHKKYGDLRNAITTIMQKVDLTFDEVVNYMNTQAKFSLVSNYNVLTDWRDYLNDCKALKYDMSDRAVIRPKDLHTAHNRTSKLIKVEKNKIFDNKIAEIKKEREDMLFTDEKLGLCIVLPEKSEDIINEGAKLNHCVGGYVDRHADGILTIVFLRKITAPDEPYYTIEINQKYGIVQCRGYGNNVKHRGGVPKAPEIIEFEREYSEYLAAAYKKKQKKHKRIYERQAV